jgi:hypothetical protein
MLRKIADCIVLVEEDWFKRADYEILDGKYK